MLSDAHVCLGLRTVTLRLSPPVFKLGGREFCVVFSCVVSRESTVRPMESGAQRDALGWTPLGGVDGLSHSAISRNLASEHLEGRAA